MLKTEFMLIFLSFKNFHPSNWSSLSFSTFPTDHPKTSRKSPRGTSNFNHPEDPHLPPAKANRWPVGDRGVARSTRLRSSKTNRVSIWFQYVSKHEQNDWIDMDRLLVYLVYLEYQRLRFDCSEHLERSCGSGPNRTPFSHAEGLLRTAKVKRRQPVPN